MWSFDCSIQVDRWLLISGSVGGRGFVGGSRVGRSGVGLGVTVVGDISDVTGIAIDLIVNVLATTVGENDVVVSLGVFTIAGLVLAHVDVSVIVLDGPVEFVVGGGLQSQFRFQNQFQFNLFKLID